jgi:hypothetical protein
MCWAKQSVGSLCTSSSSSNYITLLILSFLVHSSTLANGQLACVLTFVFFQLV